MAKAAKTGVNDNANLDAFEGEDGGIDPNNTMDVDQDEDINDSTNPMAALLASARAAAKQYDHHLESGNNNEMDDDDEDSEEEKYRAQNSRDTSRKAFDKAFKQVVDQADVVLYVLDARDPEGTRSRDIERSVMAAASGGKRLILILNKVDLVPAPVLRGWLGHLRRYFPTIPVRAAGSAANAKTFNHKDISIQNTAAALLRALKSYAAAHNLKRAVSVGVVGYPNVGKSSIINALLSRVGGGMGKKACPTGAEAGVTTGVRSVKIDSKLTLLDSPGIVFPSVSDSVSGGSSKLSQEDTKAHLVLLNAVPPKQINDPVRAVSLLLKRMSSSPELLQNLLDVYGVPPLMAMNGDVTTDFLVQVARRRGRLGRGGIPNLEAAAMTVVTDWRDGRIQGWVEAPEQEQQQKTSGMKQIPSLLNTSEDSEVLADHTVIVSEWAEEFKLDGLWGDIDVGRTEDNTAMET